MYLASLDVERNRRRWTMAWPPALCLWEHPSSNFMSAWGRRIVSSLPLSCWSSILLPLTLFCFKTLYSFLRVFRWDFCHLVLREGAAHLGLPGPGLAPLQDGGIACVQSSALLLLRPRYRRPVLHLLLEIKYWPLQSCQIYLWINMIIVFFLSRLTSSLCGALREDCLIR